MLQRAARNAYSWWWASHIRTKQSKWLEHNIEDMEEKVEYILKIIDEDEDSFAKRAEMYYRKRPELVKFVEDSFRGYRALAERYDHLSKELQSANRTIASVFPEQVQLAMDDEDEKIFQTTSNPSHNPRKPSKNLPAVPKLSIPKIPQTCQKNSRRPSRLMSKKGMLKKNVPAAAAAAAASSSGISKAEAAEEIDKLQKRILAFQTEKEFVKSSYESGLAKYWEIENQVTELQSKVSSLQHEFGIGTVIEDDEARTLMAATALEACQETLVRLQEKQEQSAEEARVEYQRIKEAHEKFETLKGQFTNHMNWQDLSAEKDKFRCTSPEFEKLDQEVDSMEQERHALELLRAKIKEELQVNSSTSLTMSELAENIDELVDKVFTLETAVSSQTALVKRLKSETNEVQEQLHCLEEDKEEAIEGSDGKSNKIRELEQELCRVQNLNQNVKDQNENLQIHFTEASFNIDLLSEKLRSVEPDEEVQNMVQCQDVRAVPGNDPEKKLQENEDMTSPGNDSKISKDVKTEEEVKKVAILKRSTSVKAEEENFVQSNLSNHLADVLVKGEMRVVPDAMPEMGFNKEEDMMASGYFSVISKDARMEEGEKKDNALNQSSSVKAKQEENFVQSNLRNRLEEGSKECADIMVPGHPVILEDAKTGEEEEKKDTIPGHRASVKAEEVKFLQSNPSNPFDDLSRCQLRAALDGNPEQMFKEHEEMKAPPGYGSMITSNPFDDLDMKPQDLETEDEDQPNWRQLFLSGLEDRENILMEEYTSILRNYKEVKNKLSEAEKKSRDSVFKSALQIKELINDNSLKDAEIQSLHKKLNLLQADLGETPDTSLTEFSPSQQEGPTHDRKARRDRRASFWVFDISSTNSDQKQVPNLLDGQNVESIERAEAEEEGEKKVISIHEPHAISTIEGKFRMDIDGLLEENIEFWLRFSTSFHQIQKFRTSVQDLQAELTKLKENKKQEGSSKQQSLNSDVRPIYKHLRDIQTELALWLEQNALLKDDLQNRLSSLGNIQDEISRSSNAGSVVEETKLNDYQAAKFQGEVLNMKFENNKVASELQAGLDRVKKLQIEIKMTLSELEEELGISGSKNQHSHIKNRSRIPLRSFLFGVRLRKQRPSLFACMSPTLQKQFSDLSAVPPP